MVFLPWNGISTVKHRQDNEILEQRILYRSLGVACILFIGPFCRKATSQNCIEKRKLKYNIIKLL